jgi:lipopolysaccharide export system permease protein
LKILTRYILWSFLRNYLISLFVLIGLYVVLDMVFNFDEFAVSKDSTGGAWEAIRNVCEYYFYQSFRIFAQLAGVIPVAAAAFTFLRLSRFNELAAMMAAGLHLVRVAMPAIICGVVVSLVLPLVNQELIIPNIIPELTRSRGDASEQRQAIQTIQGMQDSKGGLLSAARYDPPALNRPAMIEQLTVLTVDQTTTTATLLTADRATFDSATRTWQLDNGQLATGLGARSRGRQTQLVNTYATNVSPEEIALFRSGDFVELLSTQRINELLQRTQVYGTNDLQRVKHHRLAQLLLNIIMVMLAISSVLIREQGQLKYAVTRCLVLVGACMASIFICQSLAGFPPPNPMWTDRWPALMAWLPIFIFGPLSVFLMDRVKT